MGLEENLEKIMAKKEVGNAQDKAPAQYCFAETCSSISALSKYHLLT